MDEKKNVKERKNKTQRIPAPAEQIKKTKVWRMVASIVGVVAIAAISFSVGLCVSWFSLDSRMRTLIEVKKKIDKYYYEEISDERFYDALFGVINEELLDDYSGYMTPEEFAALTSDSDGNRTGVGLVISPTTTSGEDQMLILRVCGNSPAEEVGIKAGSYVIGFGATEDTLVLSESYDAFSAFLQDYGEGEQFFIRVQENGVAKNVQLSRKAYVENYVFYRSKTSAYAFSTEVGCAPIESENVLSCLDDDTAYIRIVQFTGNTTRAFANAMRIFKEEGKTNLVLDLRGNGGGYMTAAQSVASYFCKTAKGENPVMAIADYGDKTEKFYANGNAYNSFFNENSRIVVLADEGTASASECVIGAMLDYGTIGYEDICLTQTADGVAKTFGKGIMQTTYFVNLVKRDAIKLTTAKILWPVSKTCIHGVGILSTQGTKTVARDYTGETELINAINILLG